MRQNGCDAPHRHLEDKALDRRDRLRRELQEETGYFPENVERLGGFYSAPGYATEYLYLYLATGLGLSPLHAEDTESIQLIRVPLPQITTLIASGKICDAKSIAGLLTFIERSRLGAP